MQCNVRYIYSTKNHRLKMSMVIGSQSINLVTKKSMGNEHGVMLVSLTWCNWQFTGSVLSLWTLSTHTCIFITAAVQFRAQEARAKVNQMLNSLSIHHYGCFRCSACTHLELCLVACKQVCREFLCPLCGPPKALAAHLLLEHCQ